jgi:hypothetical protein
VRAPARAEPQASTAGPPVTAQHWGAGQQEQEEMVKKYREQQAKEAAARK